MSDVSGTSVAAESNEFRKNLTAYRQSLIASEQAMQGEYDKSVMTLSGGALGISFAFLKDIVGVAVLSHGNVLLGAWILWGLSISFVLASFFTSTKALRKAVLDTDYQDIYMTLANSCWATVTKWLNALGGVCFFVGVILLVVFVAYNLPK
jgi:hypothetical protein